MSSMIDYAHSVLKTISLHNMCYRPRILADQQILA